MPHGDEVIIRICPIKRLYRILAEENTDRCCAIISSALQINVEKLRGISYVFRQYEDLDCVCPGRSFSRTDAELFARFLEKWDPAAEILYCCCDAGESRSPAVAAAVMRHWGMDDMPIWRNPQYHPNMLVFAYLSEALDAAVSDEEADLRFYTNQKAFRLAMGKK